MTPKTTLLGVPKAVVDRERYFVMSLEYAGAPSLPRGLPSPPPGVVSYTVFVTAKQWRPVAAALAADPTDQMVVEGFVYYDEALETLALLAQATTTWKTGQKALAASEASPGNKAPAAVPATATATTARPEPAPAVVAVAAPVAAPAPSPAAAAPSPAVEVLVRRRSG